MHEADTILLTFSTIVAFIDACLDAVRAATAAMRSQDARASPT